MWLEDFLLSFFFKYASRWCDICDFNKFVDALIVASNAWSGKLNSCGTKLMSSSVISQLSRAQGFSNALIAIWKFREILKDPLPLYRVFSFEKIFQSIPSIPKQILSNCISDIPLDFCCKTKKFISSGPLQMIFSIFNAYPLIIECKGSWIFCEFFHKLCVDDLVWGKFFLQTRIIFRLPKIKNCNVFPFPQISLQE